MRRKFIKLKHYKTSILTVFSFLLGCMLTINITPIDKTCRIENTDREYSIMHNSKLKDPDLVILILSAPQNLDKRNIIRQTWLKFIEDEEYVVKFKMKHFFVIGSLGLTVDEILHLSTEQSQFSDILILPIHDSYQNLAFKVVKSFEWLSDQYDYGLKFKYVLKCDDDSFIRADKLAAEIINIESTYLTADSKNKVASTAFITVNAQINKGAIKKPLQVYWGYFHGNAKVKTAGKWQEPDWIVCDRYVPYALGGGYILSKKLVTFIAQNQEYLR